MTLIYGCDIYFFALQPLLNTLTQDRYHFVPSQTRTTRCSPQNICFASRSNLLDPPPASRAARDWAPQGASSPAACLHLAPAGRPGTRSAMPPACHSTWGLLPGRGQAGERGDVGVPGRISAGSMEEAGSWRSSSSNPPIIHSLQIHSINRRRMCWKPFFPIQAAFLCSSNPAW